MAAETGQYINEMAKLSHRIRIGMVRREQFLTSGITNVKHADSSVLVAAYKHRIPSPSISPRHGHSPHDRAADGAALGAATHS